MIIRQQKEAAKKLGVTATALRKWRAEHADFPDCSNGYDIAAIRAWMETKERKGSKDSNEFKQLRKGELAYKVRLVKTKAEAAEEKRLLEQGKLINVEEWELYLTNLISMTRDYFMALPQELAKGLPQKMHAKFIADAKGKVENILEYFATQIERGPGNE